jgi:hypothetical protein
LISKRPRHSCTRRNNTKSVEYRLHIRIGKRQEAKGGINNQFLITGFRITFYCLLFTENTPHTLPPGKTFST